MGISGITNTAPSAQLRRRRVLAATAQPPAQRSAAHHILLDPEAAQRDRVRVMGLPKGMTAAEAADRIVATVLRGRGPILLCVPGTLGAYYETTMLSTARAYLRHATGPVSVAAIPYHNGVLDNVSRFFNLGTKPDQNVLALVIQKLSVAAPHRQIHLTGESQGSWLIASTLRDNPSLAAAVTRVALFSKPGFVELPESVGAAHRGVHHLRRARATGGGKGEAVLAKTGNGILNIQHTDDVIAGLFNHLNRSILTSLVRAIDGWRTTGHLGYQPHRYEPDGEAAATWLLTGQRPSTRLEHSSYSHPYDS